jgi:hypothetical protein
LRGSVLRVARIQEAPPRMTATLDAGRAAVLFGVPGAALRVNVLVNEIIFSNG